MKKGAEYYSAPFYYRFYSKKITGLAKPIELAVWFMASLWLKSYYRMYNFSVVTEVK